jgi:hypothetical protein
LLAIGLARGDIRGIVSRRLRDAADEGRIRRRDIDRR